jgi:hypothetical protein
MSLFSCTGQVTMRVAADAARISDPHALIRGSHAELEALAGVAESVSD